jgi:hypothetical protein
VALSGPGGLPADDGVGDTAAVVEYFADGLGLEVGDAPAGPGNVTILTGAIFVVCDLMCDLCATSFVRSCAILCAIFVIDLVIDRS